MLKKDFAIAGGEAWGIPPETLFLLLLAAEGAVRARRFMISSITGRVKPVALNLVVPLPSHPLAHLALRAALQPIHDMMIEARKIRSLNAPEKIEANIAQMDRERRGKTPLPDEREFLSILTRLQFALRPTLITSRVDSPQLDNALLHAKDHHILLASPDENMLAQIADLPALHLRPLLRKLDESFRLGRCRVAKNQSGFLTACLTATPSSLAAFYQRTEAWGTPLVIAPGPRADAKISSPLRGDLPGQSDWYRFMEVLFRARAMNREEQLTFSPEAKHLLVEFCNEMADSVAEELEEIQLQTPQFLSLAESITQFLSPTSKQIDESTARLAISMARWYFHHHLETLRPLRSNTLSFQTGRSGAHVDLFRIVMQKVELAGGAISERDLMRRFHRPNYAGIRIVVRELVAEGIFTMDDGKIVGVGASVETPTAPLFPDGLNFGSDTADH
jgi:hypothetical protein